MTVLDRLVRAYERNNIPVTDDIRKELAQYSEDAMHDNAMHWEHRAWEKYIEENGIGDDVFRVRPIQRLTGAAQAINQSSQQYHGSDTD